MFLDLLVLQLSVSEATEEGLEKENIENMNGKRKKEDVVPLLAEVTNEQELKRYRIKAEGMEEMEEDEEEEVEEQDHEANRVRASEMKKRREKRLSSEEKEEQRRTMDVKVEREVGRKEARGQVRNLHFHIYFPIFLLGGMRLEGRCRTIYFCFAVFYFSSLF